MIRAWYESRVLKVRFVSGYGAWSCMTATDSDLDGLGFLRASVHSEISVLGVHFVMRLQLAV